MFSTLLLGFALVGPALILIGIALFIGQVIMDYQDYKKYRDIGKPKHDHDIDPDDIWFDATDIIYDDDPW